MGSSTSMSDGDNTSRESFLTSELEGITLSDNAYRTDFFSHIGKTNLPADRNNIGRKSVSFMLGDDMLEDEIAEDAFEHDYGTPILDNPTEIGHSVIYFYDSEMSPEAMERELADRLEYEVV